MLLYGQTGQPQLIIQSDHLEPIRYHVKKKKRQHRELMQLRKPSVRCRTEGKDATTHPIAFGNYSDAHQGHICVKDQKHQGRTIL